MDRSTWRLVPARRRAVAAGLLLAAAACGSGGRADPAPAPPPAPVPPPPVAARDDGWRDVRVCVVDPEGVREVPARYNLFTRDTLVDGRPFSERFPLTDAYAQGAEWFIDNGPMERAPYRYGKYGIPFYFAAHELKRVGDYRGVMLFARVEESGEPYSGLYAAVRPDCAFQTYSSDMMIASVRG